jgi:L-fuculose-phosphate aldolase
MARYGTPGTPELSESLEPLVQNYDAILLANHGVVTCGADLLTAFFRMDTVEHFAQVSLATEMLGRQVLLSTSDVGKLLEARARYGITAAAPAGPEGPVTCDNGGGKTGRISITREELDALIEEAVRKDRAHR